MQEGEIASDAHTLGSRQLVELKNGKVTFKQKILSFEKQSETLQEIVKFRVFLESRIERRDPPLTEIPDEHKPLIAKLAHESDKSLSALAKQIRQEMLPSADVDTLESSSHVSDALPLSVVEAAIKVILERNNYGLNPSNGGRVPAAISLWRWEVKEAFWDWLPKSGREKAEQRVAERVQARQDLQMMFNALPQHEQLAILDPKTAKLQSNNTNDTNLPDPQPAGDSKAQTHAIQDDDTLGTQTKSGRPKKVPDPDRLAKDKEKLEKKAAKAEKEKKAKDAQDKSRSIMASFFSKRAPATKSTIFHSVDAKARPSDTQSDFSKAFKPFVIKKGVQVASINHFLTKSKGKSVARNINQEVIMIDVLDDNVEDVIMADPRPSLPDISTMSTKERLRSLLSDLPVSRFCPPHSAFCKTYSSSSIREVMTQLTEAELAGDDGLVRALLAKLRDRRIFPAKVFIFHEDARPGYFGTLTRSSKVIGARTPYAKDLIGIDYSYDSGEEWEDEGIVDADDVVDDDDDDPQDEEADSDLDSWLVDDDHVNANDGDPDSIPPDIPEPSFNPPKRRIENEDKSGKRRKVVVPLVPFAKGPCWESVVGHCDYDPFKAYRIRLLNDTPFPIDPFKFISSDTEEQVSVRKNRNLDGSEAIHVVQLHHGPVGTAIPKRLTVAPKNTFPDTYLPFLLTKITTLQAGSITFLVEAIYQELRGNKVKKNAIEAKVREVAEKCKESRVWVIKSAFKSDASS